MRKCLVYAEFPAPYRVAVFDVLAQKYQLDVFYEYNNTEERSKDYAVEGASFKYYFLTNKEHKELFDKKCRRLKEYDFVLDYNAGLKNGVSLALHSRHQRVPYFINNDGGFVRHNFIKDILKRYIFKGAALCLANGNVSKEYFEAYGVRPERIRLHKFTSLVEGDVLDELPSAEQKSGIRKKYEMPQDKVIVITVGQFIKRKGFDLLLEAWKNIEAQEKSHLYIIGGGSGRSEYEEYIRQNNIQNITIIDYIPKDTLFRYYQASDIFVLPTREDIWGLVINEAMSQGLPIISTYMCLAAKELVEPETNGFLYDVNDTDSLARYLEKLIGCEQMRASMGKSNIEKMRGQTMSAIGMQHYTDIEEVLGKDER